MKTVLWGVLALSLTASAAQADETPQCYDAAVYGSAAYQLPTRFPDCGPDCIVMRWPWFLDLNVERAISGDVRKGSLSVLSVQHTYFRVTYRTTWWLRRNTAGGFNVVWPEDAAGLQPCPPGTPPVAPYIRPADGQTLDDMRRAIEQREVADKTATQ